MLFAPGRPKGGFTPYPAMDILSDFSSSEADLGTNVPSYFLMVLLFWRQEPVYGVLLPGPSEEPHVMRHGELEPLVQSAPAKYSRQAVSL